MKKLCFFAALLAVLPLQAQNLTGTVLCEGKPVAGVCVSDGVDIVRTDSQGRYALQSDKRQGFVFISTPSGYTLPLKDGLQADFYRALKAGPGVTEVNDFTLIPQAQDRYAVIFATDIHIRNDRERGEQALFEKYVLPNVKSMYERYGAEGPVVMFNLGDLAHDKVWYKFDWNIAKSYEYIRQAGYPGPLYSVMGNHDNDGATAATRFAPDEDFNAEHMYRSVMGPTYYSLNIGKDHWVMLDNIIYVNTPVEKAEDPGIAGKRNYRIGLSEDEWTWLQKDLETVPEGVNVRVCAHASFTFEWPAGKGSQFTDPSEMDRLYGLFVSRFGKMTAYTGHTHRFQFGVHERYPLLRDLMLPAASGNVWGTGANRMMGIDAGDAGIVSASFCGDQVTYEFLSNAYGNKWMRIYDMNTASAYLKADPRAAKRIAKSKYVTDYTKYSGKNEVYANIWFLHPDWTVEMYEGSRKLKVERIEATDPLLLASPNNENFYKTERYVVNKHLYAATARSAGSTVTVKIIDENGKVVHTESVKRPKAFSPEME